MNHKVYKYECIDRNRLSYYVQYDAFYELRKNKFL